MPEPEKKSSEEYSVRYVIADNYTGRLPRGVKPGDVLTEDDRNGFLRHGALLTLDYRDGRRV